MPVLTQDADKSEDFKFSIKVQSPDYEVLTHFFTITSISKVHSPHLYALNRTFKMPDLYLFPPGEAEQNG
jgi:competence protein ComFB